jgi:hypothetical protein
MISDLDLLLVDLSERHRIYRHSHDYLAPLTQMFSGSPGVAWTLFR